MTIPSNGLPEPEGHPEGKLLCLTICGYRKKGMSEEDYMRHMTKVTAPMTQDLMAKHGIVRWTMVSFTSHPQYRNLSKQKKGGRNMLKKDGAGKIKIHNTTATRGFMSKLLDSQMVNVADFDCFSQVIFRTLEDYQRLKNDPVYCQNLMKVHDNFADTERSM